jgi:hypothetical protein
MYVVPRPYIVERECRLVLHFIFPANPEVTTVLSV